MEPRTARLRVRVVPGARRADVVGHHGDAWKVRVTAAPEKGRANDAVASLLAERVGIAPRDVSVVAGVTARDKVVELRGVSLEEVEQRLSEGKRRP